MTGVITNFVRGKRSIAQLIQHSEKWSEEYNRNVRALEHNPVAVTATSAVNLRSCKHRIESMATPLQRCVLYLHALVATAIAIAVRRKGRVEAKAAVAFLTYIDMESCLQLAMIADAGTEGFHFKGFWDTESCDLARSALEIENFRRTFHALFVDGKVVKIGYTKHMLNVLTRPVLIPSWVLGAPKTLGSEAGVTAPVLQRCLGRMQCFVCLAMTVLRAEFPCWEILQSFSVFMLGLPAAGRASPEEASRKESALRIKLKRLAAFAGVAFNDLHSQYMRLLPVAEAQLQDGANGSHLAAWRLSLKSVTDRRLRSRYPVRALREVLIRYASFSGCTTQGVESGFAVQANLLEKCRNHMLPSTEQSELKIALDVKPKDDEARIRTAQLIWEKLYGTPRKSPAKPRLDKGVRRPKNVKYKACYD